MGRKMASLPLSPDLAALIAKAETDAERSLGADMAAVLSERGVGGSSADLETRLSNFRTDTSPRAAALKRQSRSWAGKQNATKAEPSEAGDYLAKVWPHAIARRRPEDQANYTIADGTAASLPREDVLAKSEWLVIAEASGGGPTPRITLAAGVAQSVVESLHPPETVESAVFDPDKQRFEARKTRRIGAIILSESPRPAPTGEVARAALLQAIRDHGFAALKAEDVLAGVLARVRMLANTFGDPWPDWTLAHLHKTVDDWLGPFLPTDGSVPPPAVFRDACLAQLDWSLQGDLKRLAPTSTTLPSGRRAEIVYRSEQAPLVEARVQEVFGLTEHPHIANGRIPITLSLLSPAKRQVALTRNLTSFWGGGYKDMARDMRAQYPKHDWPETPETADAHPGLTKARIMQKKS